MANKGATTVILISLLMFMLPLLALVTDISVLVLTAPTSVYGLLSAVSGYISMKDDKWLPVSVVILVIGLVLSISAFVLAWIGKNGNYLAQLFSAIFLMILVFLDLGLVTVVAKMQVFNYFDEN